MDYPSNNRSAPNSPKEPREKRVETPVIQGKIMPRKASMGRRITNIMISGDPRLSARESMQEVFVPGLKRIILDTLKQSLDRLIMGDTIPVSRTGSVIRTFGQTATRVAYENASARNITVQKESRPQLTYQQRANHDYDQVTFKDREDAVNVIQKLQACIEEYGMARVTDYYDAIGVTSDYTDEAWGWTDLSGAGFRYESDGYLLKLPKPLPLN